MKRKIPIITKPIAVPEPKVIRGDARSTTDEILNFQKRSTRDEKKKEEQKTKVSKIEPIINYSISAPQDNSTFANNNIEPYDALANITVDKPEIVALTEFLPCYNESNDSTVLNKVGKFFQAKQDANLISCVDSLKNIFEIIDSQKQAEETTQQTIKKTTEATRQELYNFCQTIESGINSIMAGVEDTKRAFNFKIDFSNAALDLPIPEDLKNLATIDEMTNTPREVWSNWTTTKTWLQMCLEFRETLQMGTSSNEGLFIIDTAEETVPTNANSPYLLHEPQNRKNKLTFNQKQVTVANFYKNATDLIITDDESLVNIQNQFNLIFSTKENSILNVAMQELIGEDISQKSKSIARLSYLIAKELKYSSELRKLLYAKSQLLTDLRYNEGNLESADNTIFWNYVVGKTGKDITDIPTNPYSENSLTTIAQRIESRAGKNLEVLSFETSYVNDNVTSSDNVSRNAVLTPGLTYYVDSMFSVDDLFGTKNAESFRDSVRIAANTIKDVCSAQDANNSQFLFDKFILPRKKEDLVYTKPPTPDEFSNLFTGANSTQQELDTNQNSNLNLELSYKNINNIVRDPLQLIRFLENQLLNQTYLIRLSEPPNLQTSVDMSALLVAFALENIEKTYNNNNLLTLLYLYVTVKADEKIKLKEGIRINNNKIEIIVEKIKKYFIDHFSNVKTSIGAQDQIQDRVDFDQIFAAHLHSMAVLNKMAEVIATMVLEFNKVDSTNLSPTLVANPFTVGTNLEKTFYTGIQKESIVSLLFFLCCLMINEVNYQSIDALVSDRSDGGNKFLTIKKTRPAVEKVEDFNNYDTVTVDLNGTTTEIGVGGVKRFNFYRYDDVILEAESKIWSEIVAIKRMSSWFASYLTLLDNKLTNLINQFTTNATFYATVYTPISAVLNDPNLTSRLFDVEQLNLLKSKLAYMKTRLDPSYDSALKTLFPYFATLRDKEIAVLNNVLPLEDLHTASWNFLLKEYLKQNKFKAPTANNLKIISIGVPQKLYRKLRRPTNADTLKDVSTLKNIVSINVYLVDHLRPTLIHKPQKFIFDLRKFPIRILNYYVDQALGISQLSQSASNDQLQNISEALVKFFPFFNLQNFQNISELRAEDALDLVKDNSFKDSNEYNAYLNVLTEEQINQLAINHIDSLFLEEYLRFSTGVNFDEQSFYNYEKSIKPVNPESLGPAAITNGAIEYLKNTMFLGQDNIKKLLVSPKKFDRVFHVALDPDDFEIDQKLSVYEGFDVIKYYTDNNIIKQFQNTNGNEPLYKRIAAKQEQFEFNSYYAELEVIA